jgi:xeroderma pigmentosum group C-complementing protein
LVLSCWRRSRWPCLLLPLPLSLRTGAVWLQYPRIEKTAAQLGIDFAPAITGFEFTRGGAVPTKRGVVVALCHRELLLEAYAGCEQERMRVQEVKRGQKAVLRWERLVKRLRLRARLQDQDEGD